MTPEAAPSETSPTEAPHPTGLEPSPWIDPGRPRDGQSTLEIHIDKIEVRTPPPPPQTPAPPPFKPRLSLAEYLRQRRAGLR